MLWGHGQAASNSHSLWVSEMKRALERCVEEQVRKGGRQEGPTGMDSEQGSCQEVSVVKRTVHFMDVQKNVFWAQSPISEKKA